MTSLLLRRFIEVTANPETKIRAFFVAVIPVG
jgi:hypothetical protein